MGKLAISNHHGSAQEPRREVGGGGGGEDGPGRSHVARRENLVKLPLFNSKYKSKLIWGDFCPLCHSLKGINL
jgi:hypothetical protein